MTHVRPQPTPDKLIKTFHLSISVTPSPETTKRAYHPLNTTRTYLTAQKEEKDYIFSDNHRPTQIFLHFSRNLYNQMFMK